MIAALEENDGGEELEWYKQAATERCITYTKAKPIKSSDGLDGYITASYRTWRWGVLGICTNRGGGFSKGNEEPSKVKQAMINRSQPVHVRRHDGVARPPDEFETHQGRPEVQRRRRILRIMTNVALLTRMMLLFQPHLRPDMTIAQDLWREWDRRLVKKFGLSGLARRRNDKRTEDCVTACIWEAVWEVFGYKQTSALYPSISKKDEKGDLSPFHPSQLYEVIRILQPSHELISDAWTRNLDLAVSTSRSGINAMSMLAEAHNFDFTDLLCRSVDNNKKFNVRDHVKTVTKAGETAAKRWNGTEVEERRAAKRAAQEAAAMDPPTRVPVAEGAGPAAAPPPPVVAARAIQPPANVHPLMQALVRTQAHAAGALGAPPLGAGVPIHAQTARQNPPPDADEPTPKYNPPKFTRSQMFSLYPVGGDEKLGGAMEAPPKLDEIQRASEKLRVRREAIAEFRSNCLASSDNGKQVDDVEQLIANSGRPGNLQGASTSAQPIHVESSETLDKRYSCIAPDVLVASIFYETSHILHWSINEYAGGAQGKTHGQWDSTFNTTSGTRANRHYAQLGKFNDGKTKYDFGWVRVVSGTVASENDDQPKLKGCADFRTLAKYIVRNANDCPTQARFCYHEESIKDTLFLLAHNEENARMVPQMPSVPSERSPYNAMETEAQMVVAGGAAQVRPTRWAAQGKDGKYMAVSAADARGWAKPRHPDSGVEDSDLQRRVDGLLLRNRLFALSIVSSNKIQRVPPVRIMNDEVQVNAGILTDHCALLAEATLAAASIPGLKNAHEKLPGSATVPTRLAMSAYNPVEGRSENCMNDPSRYLSNAVNFPLAVQTWGVERARFLLGGMVKRAFGEDFDRDGDAVMTTAGSAAGKRKRPEGTAAAAPESATDDDDDGRVFDVDGNDLAETVYALPYSYDIVNIHLSASMTSLLYDDDLESEKTKLATQFQKKYKFSAKTEHAQLTLPFPGFLDDGRQLISLARRTKPHAVDGDVPVKDRATEAGRISVRYVSACLGRPAQMHEVREWASQRAGASQYYGVRGNLFSQSVWRRHALASLMARGMIASATETAANVVRYRSSQLFARVVEHASQTANTPFTSFAMDHARPNSYRAVEQRDVLKMLTHAYKKQRREGDAEDPLLLRLQKDEDEDMVDLEADDAFAGALCRDTGDDLDAPADL